mmetsp:Transcript_1272/g.1512  ORF Transcript_1272/g.1512 Transcript_1272/m.1512 type:complete len:174 (-) Transcript_1272:1288-1809(-)
MQDFFPTNFTVGQNLKLTRELFPLLFQLMLIFCDYTIDTREFPSEEDLDKKKRLEQYMGNFEKEQKKLIEKLKEMLKPEHGEITDEDLSEFYKTYQEFDLTKVQAVLISSREEEKADSGKTAPSWTIMGVLKKLIALLLVGSIIKKVLFPDSAPPEVSDEEFKQLHLNQTEKI